MGIVLELIEDKCSDYKDRVAQYCDSRVNRRQERYTDTKQPEADMASVLHNRQSVLFADGNLNINTRGWKSDYVPTTNTKPKEMSQPLKLTPSLHIRATPTPPLQMLPHIEDMSHHEEEQVYSPIQAKPMPKRISGTPLEAELVTTGPPVSQTINIPIERLDIYESGANNDQSNINTSSYENNTLDQQTNVKDLTNEFMAELLGGPAGPPLVANLPGGEQFTKNFVFQLMDGSLTQPEINTVAQPAPQAQKKTIWDSVPIQPKKPCKKPQDQAEWEALLNANLAGMAENEEEFTKDFIDSLMGGPKEPKSLLTTKGAGTYIKSNPGGGGMRAATPPGLRSVPKSPLCWACSEPVEMGMKVLRIKGYALHPECFVCTVCFIPLKTSSVFISNERLFCREHIKFGPKSIRPLSRGPTPEFTEF